ncbi:ABC transporter permease subunit [Texas Phoenix palm phytoplasma]|uniref:ABC transporter permease subunit n=1 Tax=Texas Phoenix palm phytoplasma TaxID=176709 RepID=A0ABS5BIE7_9MOLU|nr:ABC transporter permease subunit [Texas Phoenix palm phytoplasma]
MESILIILKRFWNVLKYRHSGNFQNYSNIKGNYLILEGFLETIKINFFACFISGFLGLLLGIFLYFLRILNKKKTYFFINNLINIFISTPYLILIILLINGFIGYYFNIYYGFKAGIICLISVLIPIFSRNCEQVFLQINPELYKTSYTLGANKFQFIIYFLLRESISYLILKFISLFISSLSYSSVLSIVGLQGLGQIAYYYGFQGMYDFSEYGFNNLDLIWVCVLVLFFLVQIFHLIGNFIAHKFDLKINYV